MTAPARFNGRVGVRRNVTPDDASGTYVVRKLTGGPVLFKSRDEAEANDWAYWHNLRLGGQHQRVAVYFQPDRLRTVKIKPAPLPRPVFPKGPK